MAYRMRERGKQSCVSTRLYKYYLLSTDLSQDMEPPKSVLLYFAYQCNLDWEVYVAVFVRG